MFTSQALSTLAVAILAMAPAVQSHMIMASPKPFGSPDNSPLDPSGSNYPCKMTSATAGAGPMNDFAVGSKQQLSFSGSAVHGGGSCQISVTTDKNPTKDSVFKVIHSIEGGCPGVNGPATFDFTVPDALPDGELVMAWTWFNHIGNREMYMNCANIQVSGGASDNSKFEKLPDMAIANINVGKGASCKTAESSDYTFAGVGENGDTVDRVGSGPFVDLCGGAATPAPVASSAPAASATGGAGGVFAPGASSAPVVSSAPAASPTDAVTSTIKTLATVTAPSAAPTGPANGTAPAASAPAAAPTGGAAGSSCSTNGAVMCNGDSQFGLCDNGKVVWQAVAAGTKCENGQIAKRDAKFTHRVQRSAI
ncbi:uncharacterized protein CC84DRAFT_1079899 [Paraphaeosphaeria sporulosa]|uniref:Lytic polysaccharide monooxygenase n=1 Tax=Paraphaeosphaeria sporulosa TaxID=1460663 RepID=A0A177D1P0_9PLEO|nr:uncharacterized protein CC84DRAFT_1079899 [Paraphaeosphaeria sporulosa]OAG12949.1 hypothetical protein CC84DRAFT_1079899 [Paraphaeosphaeria sporulosa]